MAVTQPRCGVAIALGLLLVPGAVPAHARQITSEIVEALIVHLDQKDEEGRAWADSIWKVHDPNRAPRPDDTVFVLEREHLERMAGMPLADIEDLMRGLHRRRVAARWCQLGCPLGNGDQKVTINWAMPVGKDELVVEVELYGPHPRDEFYPSGLTAWMQRGSVYLAKRGQRWRVIGGDMGYFADYSAGP